MKEQLLIRSIIQAQRNNYASGGKTERTRSVRNDFAGASSVRDTSWLQVEEKPQKKRGLFGRRKPAPVSREAVPSVEEAIERLEREKQTADAPAEAQTSPVKPAFTGGEELTAVAKETEGLRSTVAEIVDKYNKRNEEDERRRIEEEARLEEERREAELRERRRLEEIRQIKEGMSPELKEAVESADAEDDFGEYEDFSEDSASRNDEAPLKVFGVTFDPSALYEDAENTDSTAEKVTADS